MGVTFTPEQKQVIDLRDRNILVSAAAGSGKTAVAFAGGNAAGSAFDCDLYGGSSIRNERTYTYSN